ncbi:MAG: DUF1328 domain-containing protein [candidate division WS1 bacterium]|jgi:uncharacterized membrane protein YtjA (UPF0391 family)|nr:DUF1328 domain-containing protein [candidate division WS1 bacterium]
MLQWALIALVLAVVAAILGFGIVASAIAEIARVLFFVFAVVFVVGLVMHLLGGGRPTTAV